MSFAHLHTCTTCTQHVLYLVNRILFFIFILFFVIGCFMSTMYNLLHIPLCTVMLILIFNSTAYWSCTFFTFYILFFISYFSFILSYVYFPCVVFSIFALSMERTRLSFHCWLYSLCIVVYVTNKTWNLKLETWIITSYPKCVLFGRYLRYMEWYTWNKYVKMLNCVWKILPNNF